MHRLNVVTIAALYIKEYFSHFSSTDVA